VLNCPHLRTNVLVWQILKDPLAKNVVKVVVAVDVVVVVVVVKKTDTKLKNLIWKSTKQVNFLDVL